ncbi:hypothetical protein [Umezawaea beigongshangensis]|nr:hypothetical protein [Umezawaea beigongshangensis]
MSLTPIYDDLMRELEIIVDNAAEAVPTADQQTPEKAAELN